MYLSDYDILLALYIHRDKPRKELKKLVLKLMKKARATTVNGILSDVINSRDHKRFIENAVQEQMEMPGFYRALVEHGYHGMVKIGKTLVPISLDIVEEEDWEWARSEERMIQIACAHDAMNKMKVQRLLCEVTLFPESGFSGIPRELEVERQIQNALGVKRLGNSQYVHD